MAKKNFRIDPVPALAADAQKALDRLKVSRCKGPVYNSERDCAWAELDRLVHRIGEVLHASKHR